MFYLFLFLINLNISTTTPTIRPTPIGAIPFPDRSCFIGWKDYDNYDIWGYDLTFAAANHPGECFGICDNIENCYGFTFGEAFIGFRCYLKRQGAEFVIPNNDTYSGYKCDRNTTISPTLSPTLSPTIKDKDIYEELWFWLSIFGGLLLICIVIIIICKVFTKINEVEKENEWQSNFKLKMASFYKQREVECDVELDNKNG